MKLNSEDFNIIKPSQGGGGGGGGGTPPENVTTWSNGEEDEDDDGDSGGQDGDSDGDSKGKKGEPTHDVTYGKGEGANGEPVDGGDMTSGGGLLSEEDSKRLQEELGIPVKLPTMSKEQIREKLKKALNDPDALPDSTKGNKGGYSTFGGGNFRAAIAEIARGKIDWKRLLKKFIGSKPAGERQFLGNRRWLHSGDYMYGSKEKIEDIGSLVAAVDVSGSMGAEEVAIILAEVKSLVRSRGIEHTTLVYFDHEVENIVELKSKDAVKKYKPVRPGSGGTNFLPPLQVMDSYFKKGKLELAVFLTDGFADDNLPKPKFVADFIWVVLNNPTFVPPWGTKVVYIKSSDVDTSRVV